MNIDQNRVMAKLLARIQQLEMDNAVLASALEVVQEENEKLEKAVKASTQEEPDEPLSTPV